ncbi:50S ribosomal protein L17 [Desulfosarcina cetonica]|uniref:50S ribosomal protein L17 n=1 Tax=Desulfosarcina cetonica TaxID=90730 RepID=UPI0006D28BC1|nr:50S ribosomal protein L17 [Desulfosarcina cetonica]
MRHRKSGVKLNRTSSHRQAMFRNMVTSLLKHDRIKTTEAKAKELRRWADQIITLAKRGDLHAMRQAMAIVREKDVVYKIFQEAGERFGSIPGGYTRIYKIGRRSGDSAPMTIIELVTASETTARPSKKEDSAEPIMQKGISTSAATAESVSTEPAEAPAEPQAANEDAAGPAAAGTEVPTDDK